jgi:hypothetical protein
MAVFYIFGKGKRQERGKPLPDDAEIGNTKIAYTADKRKGQRIVFMGNRAVPNRSV